MTSETLPETLPMQRHPETQGASRRRWTVRGLIAIAVIAVLVSATLLLPDADSSPELGSAMTHRIGRGDLLVTVTEQGTLESSNNTEIKCKVRGDNTIIWVIESGTEVKPGDELVKLDTLLIEEEISERTKYVHLAKSAVARSAADVATADLAISEYLEGRYISDLATMEKNLTVAESNLLTARNMLQYSKMMAESRYVNELDVEEREFAVAQADLNTKLIKTRIGVLKQFTKAEQLATLNGEFNAAKAQHEANKETASADEQRLLRAEEELEYCVMTAERSGMVIYPTAQKWKEAPEIEEGATVHKDQVLLLMPDLSQMQVKVGIHESVIDRIQTRMPATVTLLDKTLEGEVSSVAAVTRPAGWWTGNVVKYDTIIELPSVEGLKPGMTAEVEVILARHEDVLIVPTAAVIETKKGYACWIETAAGVQRRTVQLGDSSDMFIVINEGLKEGDEVVLDPLTYIEEAQTEAATTLKKTESLEETGPEAENE